MNPFRKKIPDFGDNFDSRRTPALAGGNQTRIEVSMSHRLQTNAQVSANVAVMATGEGCGIASFRKVIPTSEGLGDRGASKARRPSEAGIIILPAHPHTKWSQRHEGCHAIKEGRGSVPAGAARTARLMSTSPLAMLARITFQAAMHLATPRTRAPTAIELKSFAHL